MTDDFQNLRDALDSRVERGLIDRVQDIDSPLTLYNYSNECVYEKAWDEYTLEARGLILDNERECIAARPFRKFFNHGEVAEPLPDGPFTVYDKVDGSLGITFYDWHQRRWRMATRGSFASPQAIRGEEMLRAAVPWLCQLDHTYLFEIIYPENRIVVDYGGRSMLVFLGARHNETGIEIEKFPLACNGEQLVIPVGTHTFQSFDEIIKMLPVLDHNSEGFVVRWENGHRLKMKGEEYCRLHKIVSGITPLRVWEHIRHKDDLDRIMKSVPDEFQKEFQRIKDALIEQIQQIIATAKEQYEKFKDLPSRKDFALAVGQSPLAGLCFMLLDGASDDRIFDQASRMVRPTGNNLNVL